MDSGTADTPSQEPSAEPAAAPSAADAEGTTGAADAEEETGDAAGDIDFNPFTGEPKQADDLSPAELRTAVSEGRFAGLLDVREPGEYAGGSIETAVNLPLMELWQSEEAPPGLDEATEDRPMVVYCAHGVRSRQAVQLLRQRYPEAPVKNLLGGYELWRSS